MKAQKNLPKTLDLFSGLKLKAVDLFAGGGGFTEASESAGIPVTWAGNHDELAVAVHRANHPNAEHVCQDLQQADWRKIPAMDLLLASPACQGHSNAASRGGTGQRGTAPQHDAMRSTAWAVVSCVEVHRPPAVIVENVPEFQHWILFPVWIEAMRALGYTLTMNVLDAADVGVPQNRKRLFIAATRGVKVSLATPAGAVHNPFRSCLDLDAPGWAPVSGKTANVQSRVAKGRESFPTGMFLTQHVTGHPGRSLDRPIGTITTKAHWGLVREGPNGDESRMLTVAELRRGMGFPEGYKLARTVNDSVRLLGNAVPPPLGRYVIKQVVQQAALASVA